MSSVMVTTTLQGHAHLAPLIRLFSTVSVLSVVFSDKRAARALAAAGGGGGAGGSFSDGSREILLGRSKGSVKK